MMIIAIVLFICVAYNTYTQIGSYAEDSGLGQIYLVLTIVLCTNSVMKDADNSR